LEEANEDLKLAVYKMGLGGETGGKETTGET